MKSRRIAFGAIVILGMACSKDVGVTSPIVTMPEISDQAILEGMGFRKDMIEDHGDYFSVEGDIRISKASLRSHRGATKQYVTDNVVSMSNVYNITVDVHNLDAGWTSATLAAMAEWNALPGAIVHMDTSSTSPDIVMSMTSSFQYNNCGGPLQVGLSDFPSNGQPGAHVQLNNAATNCLSASQKKFNVTHELGHAIGLRHTDWFNQQGETASPYGANNISGTPTGTDASSVMNGNTAFNSFVGLSHYDVVAVETLYPMPDPGFSLYMWTFVDAHPVFRWTPVSGAVSYSIQWCESNEWIDGNRESYASGYCTNYNGLTATPATAFDLTYTGCQEHMNEYWPYEYGTHDYRTGFWFTVNFPTFSKPGGYVPGNETEPC